MAFVAAGGLCLAQGTDNKNQGGTDTNQDQNFVTKASAAGLAEVNLGRLAAERASSPEVKQFGQRLVQDHTKANTELLQIADRKKLQPAQQMDAKHQQAMQELARQNGPDFDRMFLKQMVKDHEEAVHLFTEAARHCRDEQLKQYATRTLPHLQEHLQMVRRLSGDSSGVSKQQGK
jgi:putative membrane protein